MKTVALVIKDIYICYTYTYIHMYILGDCAPSVIPPPLYLLLQEGYTILRALLYSLLNMISKFYYHLHTTMK